MKKLSPRMVEVLRRLETTTKLIWWSSTHRQAYLGCRPVTRTVEALLHRGLVNIVLETAAKGSSAHVEITKEGIAYLGEKS